MPRRTLALVLFYLLITSFNGQAGESGAATAETLIGPPSARVPPPAAPQMSSLVSHWMPVRLVIPRISVDALVEARGLDNARNLDAPRNYRDVAWYEAGPAPGQPGNALINGHVNWWTGAAVFTQLSRLRRGDEVIVLREDGSRAVFRVTTQALVRAGARVASLFAPSPVATLTLITCAGVWDSARGSDTQRLLVSAVLD
jgi:sortase (surface protein transpeptidase)